MTLEDARLWIVKSSLISTGLALTTLAIAPLFGALDWEQARRLGELILPLFLGYLTAASHYIISGKNRTVITRAHSGGDLLTLLVKGPFYLFALLLAVSMLVFLVSNRPAAVPGQGMSIDALATSITVALSILAATTSIVVSGIFPSSHTANNEP